MSTISTRTLLTLSLLAITSWALLLGTDRATAQDTLTLIEERPDQIDYRSPSLDVSLTLTDARWSAEVTHRKRPDAPAERQRFMVSPAASKLLDEALSPLRARAHWEDVSSLDLNQLGLSNTAQPPGKTLTFSGSAPPSSETFRLGAEGYGHRHYYATLADTTTPLLLLDGDLVRLFTHAPTALLDRDLLSTPIHQSKTITITYENHTRHNLSLTHHPSPEPLMRYWSYTERSPGRSRGAERFASQLFTLKVKAAPVMASEVWEEAEHVLHLTLTSMDGAREELEIRRAPSTSPYTYLARSTRSRHVVTLYEPVAKRLLELTHSLFEHAASETPLAPPRHEEGDGHSPFHHKH